MTADKWIRILRLEARACRREARETTNLWEEFELKQKAREYDDRRQALELIQALERLRSGLICSEIRGFSDLASSGETTKTNQNELARR